MTYEIFRQIDVWSTVGASVSESYKVSKNEVVKHDAPHVFSPKCTTSTWVWAEKKSDSNFYLGFPLVNDIVKY